MVARIPRTVKEADALKHKKARKPRVPRTGTHLSVEKAKPGDLAWIGPCEPDGTRRVCYFDDHLQPSDCRTQKC